MSTQLLLAAITIALGVSVLFALCAMLARDSELPASGKETDSRYKALISQTSPDIFAAMDIELQDFLLDELKQANESVSNVSARKALWVHRAQLTLGTAAVLTIGLTIMQIGRPGLLSFKSDAPPATNVTAIPASAVAPTTVHK